MTLLEIANAKETLKLLTLAVHTKTIDFTQMHQWLDSLLASCEAIKSAAYAPCCHVWDQILRSAIAFKSNLYALEQDGSLERLAQLSGDLAKAYANFVKYRLDDESCWA
jgi:hypothetical protein